MPDIRNIENFKTDLNSLGNEPSILEERGEQMEDIPPPEEGLPSDLDDLLSDTSDLEDEPSEEEAPDEESPGPELPEEGPPEPEAEPPEPEPEPATPSEEPLAEETPEPSEEGRAPETPEPETDVSGEGEEEPEGEETSEPEPQPPRSEEPLESEPPEEEGDTEPEFPGPEPSAEEPPEEGPPASPTPEPEEEGPSEPSAEEPPTAEAPDTETSTEEPPETEEPDDVSSEIDELLSDFGDFDDLTEEEEPEPISESEQEEPEPISEPEEEASEAEDQMPEEPEGAEAEEEGEPEEVDSLDEELSAFEEEAGGEEFDFSDIDIDADLNELGDEFGAPEAEGGEEEQPETGEEEFSEPPDEEPFDIGMELPEDFDTETPDQLSEEDQFEDFGDVGEMEETDESDAGEEAPAETDEEGFEDFDLPEDFGTEDAEEPEDFGAEGEEELEDFELPEEEEGELEEGAEGETEETFEDFESADEGEDEFDLPDFDTDIEDLGATVGDEIDEEEIEEVSGEDFEETEGEGPAEGPEGPEEPEDFEPEDFEPEDFGAEEEAGAEEADEESEETEEAFDVSGDFPFDEEAEEFEIDTEDFEIDAEPSEGEVEAEGFDFDSEAFDEESGPTEEGAEEGEEEEEFDLSDFENEDIEEPEQFNIPTADFDAPESADEGDIQGEDEIDEFNLGDLGIDLGGGAEEEEITEEDLNPATAVSGDLSTVEGEFELSDEDFRRLQRTLDSLPRNLKIAVEEAIGERNLEADDLKKLVSMLVAGESAKNIASVTGKLLDRRIEVPKQYEKKTGLEFEEEKESFAYIFKHNVLPILKVASLAAVALGILIFLGYRFVYKPLHSQMLYAKGHREVQEDNYAVGNGYFDRASDIWPHKSWFYTYAEEYVDKNQYFLAEEKYEQLLRRYPLDKKGVLDYARLEAAELSNYEQAVDILNRFLNENLYDYEAMLLLGDTYMQWADENPSKYANARETYAVLLERYGGQPEVLFRMLRYFIRTDNYEEVVNLKNQFQAAESVTVNPQVYAELGGYLLDKGKLDEVQDILFRAHKVDPTVPAIHYHLSRYFRRIEEYGEEEKALNKALRFLSESKPYSQRELALLINTYNKLGEVNYRNELFLDAEQKFQKAKNLYEDAKERNILGPSENFGEIYANLGDLYYYVGNDYDTAYALFEEAGRNLFRNKSIDYKMGYINYIKNDFEGALLDFYEAAGPFSNNKNLMYSTANTLYRRGAYSAAQGYYNHLLDLLENEKDRIPYLMPEEREEHKALMEMITKTYNNLGVTLNKLDMQSKDPTKYSESLRYLTISTEYADLLSRDPDTLDPTNSVQLAYLNTRSILYPDAPGELQIYDEIPKDMEELRF